MDEGEGIFPLPEWRLEKACLIYSGQIADSNFCDDLGHLLGHEVLSFCSEATFADKHPVVLFRTIPTTQSSLANLVSPSRLIPLSSFSWLAQSFLERHLHRGPRNYFYGWPKATPSSLIFQCIGNFVTQHFLEIFTKTSFLRMH